MAPRFSLPFKTVVGAEVVPEPWHYRTGPGDWLRAGASIPGWDYLTQLDMQREVRVDAATVRTACALATGAALALIVTASAPAARFRRVIASQDLPEGAARLLVRASIPSIELAGRLLLETEIVLGKNAASGERFSARHAGSRLFCESVAIDLEGSGSRLPMEVASFARHLPGLDAPRAPWHVECGAGDLHLPVMHELRVYLNADTAQTLEAVLNGDHNLHRLLKAEVARRLLETAFTDDGFVGGATDFVEGSMGQAALRLLRLCFPRLTPRDAAILAGRQPAQFDAIIRSRFANHAE